jgi:hypothetical protein
MSTKFDFDPDTNPTSLLNGTTSVGVVLLFETTDKDEALKSAQAIAGFTVDEEKIGPVKGIPGATGMSVVGWATLPIEEEGKVLAVLGFGGVIDCCSACKAVN